MILDNKKITNCKQCNKKEIIHKMYIFNSSINNIKHTAKIKLHIAVIKLNI